MAFTVRINWCGINLSHMHQPIKCYKIKCNVVSEVLKEPSADIDAHIKANESFVCPVVE